MGRMTIVILVPFQSSPGLLAGCNAPLFLALVDCLECFNPHPAFWPDATRP